MVMMVMWAASGREERWGLVELITSGSSSLHCPWSCDSTSMQRSLQETNIMLTGMKSFPGLRSAIGRNSGHPGGWGSPVDSYWYKAAARWLTFIFLGKRMSISSHEAFVVSSYSKRGPGRNSMNFSPDVYQIFRIPGLSQIYYIRICILIRPPGDFYVHYSLRSTLVI